MALAATPAFAQLEPQSSKKGAPVADAVRQWGLLGAWSLDCGQPPSSRNIYIGYVEWMGGKVMTERDYADPQRNDSNEVVSATINPDKTLTLVVDFVSLRQVRTFALMRDRPDRLRAVWNLGSDGTYSVKDGRFTGNGGETPWQYKCR